MRPLPTLGTETRSGLSAPVRSFSGALAGPSLGVIGSLPALLCNPACTGAISGTLRLIGTIIPVNQTESKPTGERGGIKYVNLRQHLHCKGAGIVLHGPTAARGPPTDPGRDETQPKQRHSSDFHGGPQNPFPLPDRNGRDLPTRPSRRVGADAPVAMLRPSRPHPQGWMVRPTGERAWIRTGDSFRRGC